MGDNKRKEIVKSFLKEVNKHKQNLPKGAKILASRISGIEKGAGKSWGQYDPSFEAWMFNQNISPYRVKEGNNQRSIICRVTPHCNLNCTYCYAGCQFRSGSKAIMSEGVLFEIISKFMALPYKNIEFIWHGGEPLLAGIEFFEKIIDYQAKLKNGQNVINSIQTNGTLLTKEWIEFFAENNFGICLSLDGPEEIHDAYRGCFERVMRAIKLLQINEVPFSVLLVVHRKSLGKAKEIYKFLVNNGIKCFDFLPCTCISRFLDRDLEPYINADEYADFLIEIFDNWINDDDPEIQIRFLDNIVRGLIGGEADLCSMAGTCKEFIAVDWNGDIYYPCDAFIGDERFKVGNILEDRFDKLSEKQKFKDIREKLELLNKLPECKSCPWWSICKGGCSAHVFYHYGNFSKKTPFCSARKKIYQKIYEVIKNIFGQVVGEYHLPLLYQEDLEYTSRVQNTQSKHSS